jgi:NADPH:quinone reductase-like Zn-dependent oxidoreductase
MGNRETGSILARINTQALVFLKGLLEAGKAAHLIDRRYPLNEAPEAIRYLGEGHAPGKIVITVAHK